MAARENAKARLTGTEDVAERGDLAGPQFFRQDRRAGQQAREPEAHLAFVI
jgi:hypothetical protein